MPKLNILHHKDWHVYTKTNRDKVKEDERKAAKIETEKQEKITKIEQERRLNELRRKAQKEHGITKKKVEKFRLFEEEEKYGKSEIVEDEKAIQQKKKEDLHTWFLGIIELIRRDKGWEAR
jgi:hypothetical protein